MFTECLYNSRFCDLDWWLESYFFISIMCTLKTVESYFMPCLLLMPSVEVAIGVLFYKNNCKSLQCI